MATYIKPNAIKDASIEGIKIKDGTISSSKIDGTVASKSYVDTAIDDIKVNSSSGAYAEVNHGTADTTFTLTPNTFHIWDKVSSLTLTLGSDTAGVANEFLCQFTSGEPATTLSLPSDLKWANDSAPTITENMIYQVSILKGLASVLVFSNISLIFFYTDNPYHGPYQAEQGMTWEDWVNSKYNTDKATISNNKIFIGPFVFIGVIPSDIIISDNTYTLRLD